VKSTSTTSISLAVNSDMSLEIDPIASDLRTARAARRLPPDAACALCGEPDVRVLSSRRRTRSILELHHALGRQNDLGAQVTLCLNCHARASNGQRDVGVFDRISTASDLDRLRSAMRSMASFYELQAKSCSRWAEQLSVLIARLDETYPEWRVLGLDHDT
jgi:hypothetical protein